MLLLGMVTAAHALMLPNTHLEAVHGWTADGALVFEVTEHASFPSVDYHATNLRDRGSRRYVLVQRREALVERWLLAKSLPAHIVDDAPLQTDAWTAWRSTHPLSPATQARSAPTGVRLEVRVDDKDARVAWNGAECAAVVGVGMPDDPSAPTMSFSLSNGGEGTWPLYQRTFKGERWDEDLELASSARWSADGRWVALTVERAEVDTMWGVEFPILTVTLSPAAPLVGVLAPPSLEGPVANRVTAALDGLGFIQRAPAKAERAASVVFFAPGYESDAAAIAARVPGGASVEPLSWAAPQHVVVAVGASAR